MKTALLLTQVTPFKMKQECSRAVQHVSMKLSLSC